MSCLLGQGHNNSLCFSQTNGDVTGSKPLSGTRVVTVTVFSHNVHAVLNEVVLFR